MPFIVLSSSKGTVFAATLERIQDGSLTVPCIGLITDRPDRGSAKVAVHFGVPVRVVETQKDDTREHYDRRVETAILELCRETKIEPKQITIALMGWMKICSPWLINEHRRRILNVHP